MSYLPKDPAIFLPAVGNTEEDLERARKRIDDMNEHRWSVRGLHEAMHVDPIAEREHEVDATVKRLTAQMTIEEMREEYVELRLKGGLLFEILVRGRVPKDAPAARWLFEARKLARERSKRR